MGGQPTVLPWENVGHGPTYACGRRDDHIDPPGIIRAGTPVATMKNLQYKYTNGEEGSRF